MSLEREARVKHLLVLPGGRNPGQLEGTGCHIAKLVLVGRDPDLIGLPDDLRDAVHFRGDHFLVLRGSARLLLPQGSRAQHDEWRCDWLLQLDRHLCPLLLFHLLDGLLERFLLFDVDGDLLDVRCRRLEPWEVVELGRDLVATPGIDGLLDAIERRVVLVGLLCGAD